MLALIVVPPISKTISKNANVGWGDSYICINWNNGGSERYSKASWCDAQISCWDHSAEFEGLVKIGRLVDALYESMLKKHNINGRFESEAVWSNVCWYIFHMSHTNYTKFRTSVHYSDDYDNAILPQTPHRGPKYKPKLYSIIEDWFQRSHDTYWATLIDLCFYDVVREFPL